MMMTVQEINIHLSRELQSLSDSDYWQRKQDYSFHQSNRLIAEASIFVSSDNENRYVERLNEIVAALEQQGFSASYEKQYAARHFAISDANGGNLQQMEGPARYNIRVEGTRDQLSGLKLDSLPGMSFDTDNQNSLK